MMNKLLYLWALLLCGLLNSCINKEASDIFDRVEEYMEIYPDSALLLLNRIPHPEKLSGRQRADYAMLLTQARDKNCLDSLQSDSLMKFAVDYYQDSDDKVKAGKAFFYYGKLMALLHNDTLAAYAYLAAQKKLEQTENYKLQAFVQEYLGVLYEDRGMHDIALDDYRKSAWYYKKAEDTLGIIYAYRNIGRIHDKKQNADSSFLYLNYGIKLLKGDSASLVFPSLLHMKGIAEKKRGNYANAIDNLLAAIRLEDLPNSAEHYYLSLGDVYLRMGELDKARECFEQAMKSKVVFTQSGAYYYLYLVEKQKKNYAQALYYMQKSDSLLNMDKRENTKGSILSIQHKYEVENWQLKAKLLEQEKLKQFYFWLFLSTLLIIACIMLYFWIRKYYRRIYKERLNIHVERSSKVISENERIIGQCLCRIEELQQEKEYNKELAKKQIAELNKNIQMLIIENKRIREEPCVFGVYVLEQLKKKQLVVENMSLKEKKLLFEYVDLVHNDFASKLKTGYNLNENNLLFAVLIKLGFTSDELMFAFQCEMNSILKKKQRLKSKFRLGKNDGLETFFTNFFLCLST